MTSFNEIDIELTLNELHAKAWIDAAREASDQIAEASAYFEAAHLHFDNKEFWQAAVAYEESLILCAQSGRGDLRRSLQYNLGLCRYELKDDADSVAHFSAAETLDRDSGDDENLAATRAWLATLARLSPDIDRLVEKFRAFDELIRSDSANPAPRAERGILFLNHGVLIEAVSDLTAALSEQPQNAEWLNERGLAYAALFMHEEAKRDFAAADQLNPSRDKKRGWIRWREGWRIDARIRALARGLGAFTHDRIIRMRLGGVPVTIEFTRRVPAEYPESHRLYIRITALTGPLPEMRFRSKNFWDDLAARFGNRLLKPSQSPSASAASAETNPQPEDQLDRVTHFERRISADAEAEKILSDPDLRRAIPALFDAGIHDVMFDRRGITLYPASPLRKSFTADLFTIALRPLQELAVAVRKYSDPAADITPQFKLYEKIWKWVGGACGVLMLASFFAVFAMDDEFIREDWNAFFFGLGSAVLLMIPFTVGVKLLLRSWTETSEYFQVLVFIGFVAFWPFSTAALSGMNGFLDNSPATRREVRVLQKRITVESKNKSNTHLYCDVTPWPPLTDTLSLKVSKDFFDSVDTGSRIFVTTRAGFLGWEYRTGFEKSAR